MAKRKKHRVDVNPDGGEGKTDGLGSALADALKAKGFSASVLLPPEELLEETSALRFVSDILLDFPNLQARKERKGRHGKTVTLIGDFASISREERALIAKEMGSSLGCGAFVEEGTILLQGDQVARVGAWLKESIKGASPRGPGGC